MARECSKILADAITYVMADRKCKIVAYIDDFVAIAPRVVADECFNDLSNLFSSLGLPMNQDKKPPPAKPSHVWAYMWT